MSGISDLDDHVHITQDVVSRVCLWVNKSCLVCIIDLLISVLGLTKVAYLIRSQAFLPAKSWGLLWVNGFHLKANHGGRGKEGTLELKGLYAPPNPLHFWTCT